MRRIVVAFIFGLATWTIAAGLGQAEPKGASVWSHDVRAAYKQSVKENRPMLLVFGAEWCTYCKKLEKTTLVDPKIANYVREGFIPVHVDVDNDPELAKILKIKGLPCSVVVSSDVKVLGRLEGYKNTGEFYAFLTESRGDNVRGANGLARSR